MDNHRRAGIKTQPASLGEPFFVESGRGPAVVCLHANASTSGQWRPLVERLSPRFRVLAPDTLGAGRSPDWPGDGEMTLSDESHFLEPVFTRAGEHFSLVGHSYGGAVGLIAALARPERVRCLVLYEPTLFSLLHEESPGQEAFLDIMTVAEASAADIDAGDHHSAAARFIDYWMGPGSWRAMPASLQDPVAFSMRNVRGWANALSRDATPLDAFQRLEIPILYMVGEHSPISSKGVARLLTSVLPSVEYLELEGVGHMAPLTHPAVVNPLIEEFLTRHQEGTPDG